MPFRNRTSAPQPTRRSQPSQPPQPAADVEVQAGPPVLDALKFGFTVQVEPPSAIEELIHELRANGAREVRQRLRFNLPVGRASVVDYGTVELSCAVNEGVIRSDSTFQMNPQRALARELGSGHETTLDGADNFLGWQHYQRSDLAELEGRIVERAVDHLAEDINRSLPVDASFGPAELRLKAAELAMHLRVRDAVGAVRLLQRSALPGALVAEHDVYRTNCSWPDEGPTVRWWLQRSGFVVKVYAKTRTVIRVEVSAADRVQVVKLGCKLSRGDIDAVDARALLDDFRTRCQPILARAVEHVTAVVGATKSIWELQVALSSLTRLAAGQPTATGRPPSHEGVEAARAAVEALFTCGLYVCRHRKEHAIRTCLDGLSGPDGPLVREGWRSAYSLAPQFARTVGVTLGPPARPGKV